MILGKIIGRTTTREFEFLVEGTIDNAKKFEFVQVPFKEGYVLCQVVEILRDSEKTIAKCNIIGYKDEGKVKQLREAFKPGTEVLKAQDEFVKDIIELNTEKGAYVGKLDGKDINVNLDLRQLLTKHITILAKSGAGKSYTVGVLLEEIMDKKVPLLIIDPHGEYSQMKYPNDNKRDKEMFEKFGVSARTFIKNIQEFSDPRANPDAIPLKLSNKMDAQEIAHILPGKMNSNQLACLYTALKDRPGADFDSLILELQTIDNNVKWGVIDMIDYLRKMQLFSFTPTDLNELIQPGKASIINLKGIDPEVGEVIVYKLMKDLFEARKKEKIPPFFAIIEEAHNYCPERSFGEAKSSKILRTIASEGRKFGLGLCIVSQRPARVDKNVISQASTQIILKITNPNDLKAVSTSVEGITAESEAEIKNLPVGTALITGVVDMPLFVNIRPRKTKHGGVAVEMINEDEVEEEKDFLKQAEKFEKKNLMPLIKAKTTKKDIELMSEQEIKELKTYLIPAVLFECKDESGDFNLLVELSQGKMIKNIDENKYAEIPDLTSMSMTQVNALMMLSDMSQFTAADIMERMGITFTQSQEIINALSRKDFLHNRNGKYELQDKELFNPKVNSYYGRIEYDDVEFTDKVKKGVSLEETKEKLQMFAEVAGQKECWIVFHKAFY